MKLEECLEKFIKHRTKELVITNVGDVQRFLCGMSHKDTNLYGIQMSYTAPFSLGLALALPNRKIVALDGDGSTLMGLGAMTTIASISPRNLLVIIFNNQSYDGGGGVPSYCAGKANLELIAKGAGIENVAGVKTIDEFERALVKALGENQLNYIVAYVESRRGKGPGPSPFLDHVENTIRFQRALIDEGLVEPWHDGVGTHYY